MIVGLPYAIHPSYMRKRFSDKLKSMGIVPNEKVFHDFTRIFQLSLRRLKHQKEMDLDSKNGNLIAQQVLQIVNKAIDDLCKNGGNLEATLRRCSKEIEKNTGFINIDPLHVYYNPDAFYMLYCRVASVIDIFALNLIAFYKEYTGKYPVISQADKNNYDASFNSFFSACISSLSELCEKNKLEISYEYTRNDYSLEKHLRRILKILKENDQKIKDLTTLSS